MSRSARAFQSGTLPMITLSMTRNWSKANWSWRRTPNFLGRVMEPLVGSRPPVRIFISVDLPAPLGPVTASNRMLAPKRMEILLTESKAIYHDSPPGQPPFGAPDLGHDVECEEQERRSAAQTASEFLVTGGGADADVDLVDALEGSGGEAGVEDLGVRAGARADGARKRFGRWRGGAPGDFGRDGAEADGVYVDDLSGIDRPHKSLRPVLTEDWACAGDLFRGDGRDDFGEIKRGVIAGGFGLDSDGSAIGLYVPRDDDAHAGGCELHYRDFALADPHGHVAEPGIGRDRAVYDGVRQAGTAECCGKPRDHIPAQAIEIRCVSDEFDLRAVVHVDLEDAAVPGYGVNDFAIAGNRGRGNLRRVANSNSLSR